MAFTARPRVTRAQAAQHMSKSTRTVDIWRKKGFMPPSSGGDGRGVMFDPDDFDIFMEEFKHGGDWRTVGLKRKSSKPLALHGQVLPPDSDTKQIAEAFSLVYAVSTGRFPAPEFVRAIHDAVSRDCAFHWDGLDPQARNDEKERTTNRLKHLTDPLRLERGTTPS